MEIIYFLRRKYDGKFLCSCDNCCSQLRAYPNNDTAFFYKFQINNALKAGSFIENKLKIEDFELLEYKAVLHDTYKLKDFFPVG